MSTAILPSHGFLRSSLTSNISRTRRQRNHRSSSDRSRSTVHKLPAQNNIVMEKVKILKRGEALPPCLSIKEEEEEEEETSWKQIGVCCSNNIDPDDVAFFAGRAYFASPPPSLVPLPRFVANNSHQWAARGLL